MFTLIALPLVILIAAVLLVLAFVAMQKRTHPNDRLSASGPALHTPEEEEEDLPPPNPLRSAINGDQAKLLRLIETERRLNPFASDLEIELLAYERLRKNRGNN